MRQVQSYWKEQRLIESFDVDMLSRLRPQTMFAFLLNSAWNHTKGTTYGYEQLSARNLIWALIKVQMIIKGHPKWGDQVEIETWGKRIERLCALRDFVVSSTSGNRLIMATSSWVVLDRTSGRPQKFDTTTDGFPWQLNRDAMETNLQKVPEQKDGKKIGSFRVQFSDIDVHRHVNSAKYLQWMIDSHSQEELEAKELSLIDMSFLAEALPRDEVEVYSEESSGHELCCVRRIEDKKELCRAEFEWRPTR
jgi:medium-chain acyl-[acyl-carrier-protein] hydrolase